MSTETEPRRLGRYELHERLGRGGMAEVWKAFDTQLQRYVAIKVLHADLRTDPNFTSRFEREAQLIAALHHPNIVQIYDFQVSFVNNTTLSGGNGGTGDIDTDEDEPAAYMIMDYVEGQTLAQYLHNTFQQGHFLSSTELLHLFIPICKAVEYAHKKGMVHRDLKPANILLDERNKANNPAGEPIISDFGISKMLDDQTQTQHGFWLGTPAYIAPEQVEGEHTTERSDIYALAIILYETCTGTLPFRADGPVALAMQHVKGTPVAPNLVNPRISQELSDVIMQGMEKDPNNRFSTASALLKALTDVLGTSSITTATASDDYATSALNDDTDPAIPQIPMSSEGEKTSMLSDAPTIISSSGISNAVGISASPANVATPQIADAVETPDAPTFIMNPAIATPATRPKIPTLTTNPGTLQNKRNKKLLPILLVCLLVAALASGTYFVLPHFAGTAQAGTGTLNFLNSGQFDRLGTAGITDEAQLSFTALPAPDAGKAYYAWILSDTKSPKQLNMLLGKLQVKNGNAQLLFNGDANHSNILAHYSRFVLTQQDASPTPNQPGTKSTWRYYGEIPNIPIPSDIINHYSLLDHMRHLTADDPIMNSINLHGGLNLWFGRNTEKLLESATSARDEMNPDLVHRQVVRTLDYLDGSTFSKVDVPAGTSFLIDPQAGQVGLLTFSQDQPVPGLVTHVAKHLLGLSQAPGVTDAQTKLANQLTQETQQVEKELGQARVDAQKLVMLDNTQLAQPEAHTLLNDLAQEVNIAYVGQRDATSGELSGGVEQISAQVLHLSMIEIKPYMQ